MSPEQQSKSPEALRIQRARVMLDAARRAVMFGQAKAKDTFPRRTYAIAEQSVPRTSTRAVGRTGLPRGPRGLVHDDPSPSLQPYQARGFGDKLGIFDEMWRSDPIIAGTLDMIAREISRAPLVLDPIPSPSDAEQRGMDLAARYLGLDGTQGWLVGGIRAHISDSLRKKLQYGHSPYEVLWASVPWVDGDVLAPCRLLYRAPNATWGWLWDRDTLKGLIQLADRGTNILSLLGRSTVTIRSDRLLLYTHNGSASVNPEGVSMLRPAWIWWRSKQDVMLRYHEASETLFNGVTVLEETPHPKSGDPYASNSATDLDLFEDLMDQHTLGLLSFFFQPLGYKIRQDHPEFKIPSPEALLKYFDLQISLVFTAQLLGQAPGQATLSAASGQLLFNSIDALAKSHLETFNGQAGVETSGILAKLVRANIPEALSDPTFRFPRLRAVGIQFQDTKAWIDSVTKASQFRVLSYSAETEVQLRAVLDLPPLSPEQLAEREAWEVARLEAETSSATAPTDTAEDTQERASETGTQAPVVPPEQEPIQDTDGF